MRLAAWATIATAIDKPSKRPRPPEPIVRPHAVNIVNERRQASAAEMQAFFSG